MRVCYYQGKSAEILSGLPREVPEHFYKHNLYQAFHISFLQIGGMEEAVPYEPLKKEANERILWRQK